MQDLELSATSAPAMSLFTVRVEEQSRHPAPSPAFTLIAARSCACQQHTPSPRCSSPHAIWGCNTRGGTVAATPVLCWKTPDTAELTSLVQMSDGSEGEDGTSHAFTSMNKGNKTCIWEPPPSAALSKHWSWLIMQQSCACPHGIRERWLDFRVLV